MSKQPENFQVKECEVRVYYVEELKGWSWRCATCDTSTQQRKHGKHLHKLESDAVVGSKYHRNAKRLERQKNRWRAWWYHELMLITNAADFEAHWRIYWWDSWRRYEPKTKEQWHEIMHRVQNDPHIKNLGDKFWKQDQEEYGDK